jgi:hypothetical protein
MSAEDAIWSALFGMEDTSDACVVSDVAVSAIRAMPDADRIAFARELVRAAGYAVVPVEATPGMTLAANKRVAVITPDGTWALARDEAARTWAAMIAAAQEPTP